MCIMYDIKLVYIVILVDYGVVMFQGGLVLSVYKFGEVLFVIILFKNFGICMVWGCIFEGLLLCMCVCVYV